MDVLPHTGLVSGLFPRARIFENVHLVSRQGESILIDTHATVPDAIHVAQVIKSTGNKLKAIFVTHAHPDHFAGTKAILDTLGEDVPVLASPPVADEIQTHGGYLLGALKGVFGEFGTNPEDVVVPKPYCEETFTLGDREIRLVNFEGGEAEHQTAFWLPEERGFIAGDMIYNGVHPALFLKQHEKWLAHLDTISQGALDNIYPGHGPSPVGPSIIGELREYIEFFVGAVSTKGTTLKEVIHKIRFKLPHFHSDYLLGRSVSAFFPEELLGGP